MATPGALTLEARRFAAIISFFRIGQSLALPVDRQQERWQQREIGQQTKED